MGFINENKTAIAFAAVLMLAVSAGYFYLGAPGTAGMGAGSTAIYDGMRYKIAYSGSDLEIYALAKSNQLSKFAAEEGNSIPEENSMVLGFLEGNAMKDEKEISGPGSRLRNLFGINTTVEGILKKTGQPVDMLHFLSATQFAKISGTEGIVFSRLNAKKEPKMFFVYDRKNRPPSILKFAEGSMDNFATTTDEDGKRVCPVIIGADEARMMRSENLFKIAGDRINGFFGNDVEIAGVLEKTNSSLDMFHFVSPDCSY